MRWTFGGKPARGGVSLTGYSDWPEWWKGDYNWRNFTLIKLDVEDSGYKDSWEINVGLLGFNWCLTRWWRGQFLEKIEPIIEDIESGKAEREGRIRPIGETEVS